MRLHTAFAAIVLCFALLPASAFAQAELTSPPDAPGLAYSPPPLLVATVGILGAAVVVDLVTRGALSGPLLRLVGTVRRPFSGSTAAAVARPVALH